MEIIQKKSALRILVMGANGGIGRQFVDIAINEGHYVTAVLRDPSKLTLSHKNLTVVKGDILQPDTFEKHMENTDAVISAVGNGGDFFSDKPTTLYSQGNANLISSMKKWNVSRIFVISASAVEISPVLPFYVRIIARYVVQKLLKNMYADLLAMEVLVKNSDVSWTIVRPPQLTDGPRTGRYRFAINSFLKNCFKISRADVADFMLKNVTEESTFRTTIEVGY